MADVPSPAAGFLSFFSSAGGALSFFFITAGYLSIHLVQVGPQTPPADLTVPDVEFALRSRLSGGYDIEPHHGHRSPSHSLRRLSPVVCP